MSEPSSKRPYGIARRDDDPVFSSSMAAAFFDLGPASFREKERLGYWVESNGEPIKIRRSEGGVRMFSLNDILKIAHSLRRLNKMTDRQLRLIVLRVDAFKEPVKKNRKKFRKGTIGGQQI